MEKLVIVKVASIAYEEPSVIDGNAKISFDIDCPDDSPVIIMMVDIKDSNLTMRLTRDEAETLVQGLSQAIKDLKEIEWKEVHRDTRGELYVLEWMGREVLFFSINKGCSRGGDYHGSRQYDLVLAGKVTCRFKHSLEGREVTKTLSPGDSISFEAGFPHMFTALENSLMVEWLTGPFERTMYRPYREILEGEEAKIKD